MRDCSEEENEYLKRYAEQERNVTGPRRSVHLWEFLLELLMDDSSSAMIQWTDEVNGEFKLKNSEDVARKWGQRKHKEGMNYDKLSRALRYYYSKEIIKKVSGRRFVYKFVPSPEIYAAVNAIKAHMIRNGAQQIPLGPFPHYRQSDNIPTTPQDTKPFLYYPHIRPRSISPRIESDITAYPPRPSPPRSRSPNCFRPAEERYKNDLHLMLGRSYQNDELVRKIKYFEQEEAKYTAPTDHFPRRHHSENEYHRDENRNIHHQRLTPPIDSHHETRHLQTKYYSPSYEFNSNERTPNENICLNNTVEKTPEQLREYYHHQSNGVLRESENHHEDRKPSAFISLESRRTSVYNYPTSQVKSEPQSAGYCKDCPSCNLQPSVSECQRNVRRYDHENHNGYHNDRSPPARDEYTYYHRRHMDSTSSDDVFYPRKYVPMIDASTQTDTTTENVASPKREYFNDDREREREREREFERERERERERSSSWVDLNMTSDLRIKRSNEHTGKPVSPSQYHAGKPVSPSQYHAGEPVSPSQYHTGKPVSPSQYHAGKPVSPSQYHTGKPVSPSQYHTAKSVSPSQYPTGKPVSPSAQYHTGKPVSPSQYNTINNTANNNNNNNTNGTSNTNNNDINEKRKSYSPDDFNGSDNISRISTPSSITSPPTPGSAPLMCKCGCMDSAGSPTANMPTTNGTVVVYPKEVL